MYACAFCLAQAWAWQWDLIRMQDVHGRTSLEKEKPYRPNYSFPYGCWRNPSSRNAGQRITSLKCIYTCICVYAHNQLDQKNPHFSSLADATISYERGCILIACLLLLLHNTIHSCARKKQKFPWMNQTWFLPLLFWWNSLHKQSFYIIDLQDFFFLFC